MSAFHELYDEQALATPAAPALACHRPPRQRAERSYGEVRARSLEFAAGLQQALATATARGGLHGSPAAREAGARLVLAIRLARTHEDFLPLLVAASRCGATFVLMSTDLREKELEVARNELIVAELQPCLVLAAAGEEDAVRSLAGVDAARVVTLESLTEKPPGPSTSRAAEVALSSTAASMPLCFMFTGGTRRGRCVVATHAMVCHERARYPELVRLPLPVRVLANTSVYWAASALGQLSIALAYGGCAVLCEASETDELRAAIAAESVDVLGLVPDQLRVLAADPAAELPSVRLVFTWGEALPAVVAEKWRSHPLARLRELLISTEYWLSLYAAPLEDGGRFHRAVRGVQLLVAQEDGEPVAEGEVGELLLGGPMVTSGYVSLSSNSGVAATEAASAFRKLRGGLYFRTRDLVRVAPGGVLEFRGRADMTTKVKGKWVDLLALEEALRSVEAVLAAALLPDPRGGAEPHAFLVLQHGCDAAVVLRAARSMLPRSAQLHVVDHMPRHPVTRKVDVKALEVLASPGDVGTWPLAPDMPIPPEVCIRARKKMWRHGLWTLAAAVVASSWDLQGLRYQLCCSRSGNNTLDVSGPGVTALGFLLFPYMHHASIVAVDRWPWMERLLTNVPMGMWGLISVTLGLRGVAPVASGLRHFCGCAAATWAVGGAGCAWAGGRLFSYPVVFWVGIGHRFEYDNLRWLEWRLWRGYFEWQGRRLLALLPWPSSAAVAAPATKGPAAAVPPQAPLAAPAPSPPAEVQPAREASAEAQPAWEASVGTEPAAGAGHDAKASEQAPVVAAAPAAEGDRGSGTAGKPPMTCFSCGRALRLEWPPKELAAEPEAEAPDAAATALLGGARDGRGNACCWQCWPAHTAALLEEASELAKRALLPPAAAAAAPAEPEAPEDRELSEASQDRVAKRRRCAAPAEEPECKVVAEEPGTVPKEAVAMEVDEGDGAQVAVELPDGDAAEGLAAEDAEAAAEPPDGDAAAGLAAEDAEASSGKDGQRWTPQEVAEWQRHTEQWWWYNKTEDNIDVRARDVEAICSWGADSVAGASQAAADEAALAADPRLRRLCRCVAQVEGEGAAASPSAPLLGLDSLHVALLTTRVRAEFGLPALSISAVRNAATVAELLETVGALEQQACAETTEVAATPKQEALTSAVAPERAEYALSYSPGQYAPMGAWVLRSDGPVHAERLEEALGRLVERHVALRARPRETLRLLSFFLDASILLSLCARLLDRGSWPMRALRRLCSSALSTAWPRVGVAPRSEVYARHASKAPFSMATVYGQHGLESMARSLRNRLQESKEPIHACLVSMELEIEGHWVCGVRGGEGDVAVLRVPSAKEDGSSSLVLVELKHGQAGILVGPGDERWRHPPYGFPALLSAQLQPGSGIVWLRLAEPGEMAILWKPEDDPGAQWKRRRAFRMPSAGATPLPHVINFLVVMALHSLADGHSYEPIIGDLLALYTSLAPGEAGASSIPVPPLLGNSLLELQNRLFSTLHAADFRASPQQLSLRGSQWKFYGKGYGHLVGLQRGAITCLRHVGQLFGAPLDALLLALTAASIARASREDSVLLTLYVPVRDGPGESGFVGLFADWRDLKVHVDRATATVLGVVLDVAHALRLRRWAVFNALRKPEGTFINFQPLDAARRGTRGGFSQIGEELWRIKESLGGQERRGNTMDWVPQALSVTIEQQDEESWWLLLSCDAKNHPPAWMRRFVKAFEDSFWALLTDPMRQVHTEYPEGYSLPERKFDAGRSDDGYD